MARGHHSAMLYVVTFGALLVLTGLTFLLSGIDLGAARIPLALAIAAVKGFLVAWFFMHLNEQRGVNRIFFVVAVLFIVILIVGMGGDVRTRGADVNEPPPAVKMELEREQEKGP
jgi:cytochrome c oxidase subunit IV